MWTIVFVFIIAFLIYTCSGNDDDTSSLDSNNIENTNSESYNAENTNSELSNESEDDQGSESSDAWTFNTAQDVYAYFLTLAKLFLQKVNWLIISEL